MAVNKKLREIDIKNHPYYYLDNLIGINYLGSEKLK